MTPADVRRLCRVVRACEARGEVTQQQARTIIGQAKHVDPEGAMRGLRRLYERR